MDTVIADDPALSGGNERMIVVNHGLYWAHLSIYRFAIPFAEGRRVLDAGSGAGYGAAYLARHGAAGVLALEGNADVVAHSRRRYTGDAVTFEVADLNERLPVGDRTFGLVFSSNVFEHVGNVDGLAAECARVVTADGVLIVAVPPITSASTMIPDVSNQFHVHHIPPVAWHRKLSRFFTDVNGYSHFGLGQFARNERLVEEFNAPPDRVTIRETDFEFPETAPAAMEGSLTAIFVCSKPRREYGLETLLERTPSAWREGEVAARAIASERAIVTKLYGERDAALRRAEAAEARCAEFSARVMALQSSTSWRVTAPLRAVRCALNARRVR